MSRAIVHHGDCLDVLRTLEAGSVQTCVTSPPYFGLRSYDETALRIESAHLPAKRKAPRILDPSRRRSTVDGQLDLFAGGA